MTRLPLREKLLSWMYWPKSFEKKDHAVTTVNATLLGYIILLCNRATQRPLLPMFCSIQMMATMFFLILYAANSLQILMPWLHLQATQADGLCLGLPVM